MCVCVCVCLYTPLFSMLWCYFTNFRNSGKKLSKNEIKLKRLQKKKKKDNKK